MLEYGGYLPGFKVLVIQNKEMISHMGIIRSKYSLLGESMLLKREKRAKTWGEG